MSELKENTVQQTLCMPLWGRAIAAKKYPSLFPDHDAGRIVKELGAGLSCLRRQMGNETNPWYCLDMENVISLRENHIPPGKLERNVVCDLNDFSWFDQIDFCLADEDIPYEFYDSCGVSIYIFLIS